MVSIPTLWFKKVLPLAGALAILALPSMALAAEHFNTHVINETGSIINDFHLKISGPNIINVTATYTDPGPIDPSNPGFPNAVITDNNTNCVIVTWSGRQFNPGDVAHIGVTYTGDNSVLSQIWWTFAGIQVGPLKKTPSCKYLAASANWSIVRAHVWSDLAGTTLLSTAWYEEQRVFDGFLDCADAGPTYVSYSQQLSPTEVPLANLNPTLGGFPPDGPIALVTPPAGIPTLSEWGVLALVLILAGSGAYVLRRRTAKQRTA